MSSFSITFISLSHIHHTHQSLSLSLILAQTFSTVTIIKITLLLMAPSGRSYHLHPLKVAITVVFIFFSLLPSKSGGSVMMNNSTEGLDESKMMIGSKPPACVNKCKNCRPCLATLVVPNHQKRKGFKVSSRGDDDTYYLLSWRCRCGDKLFQP